MPSPGCDRLIPRHCRLSRSKQQRCTRGTGASQNRSSRSSTGRRPARACGRNKSNCLPKNRTSSRTDAAAPRASTQQKECNMATIKLQAQSSAADDGRPEEATASDPFDLNVLRLDQSFVETAGVKKLLTTVPVRRPHSQDFVRVHADPEYRAALALIELRDDREIYLLTPDIARQLPGEFVMATLYTTITRPGVVHLWPVKLPPPDGRIIEWHRSAAEAAELAMRKWVRMKANMTLGALRNVRGTEHHPGSRMAHAAVQRAVADRLPRSLRRQPRPRRHQATAWSCLMRCPIVRLWPSTSSSSSAATILLQPRAARANGRARSAWSRASCAAGRPGGCGGVSLDPCRHSRSGRCTARGLLRQRRTRLLPRPELAAA